MDIYFNTSKNVLVRIFKDLGFKLKKKKKYVNCTLKQSGGRFHAMFAPFKNGIYCDFHFDKPIHFMFLNVNFKKMPSKYYKKNLLKLLKKKKIKHRTVQVTWLTKRNRGWIVYGFRI